MTDFRHIVYMVLDELKIDSDDSYYTPEHVIFLVSKYRALLLKQRYSDLKRTIALSNYSSLTFLLVPVSSDPCGVGIYLRSSEKLPDLMDLAGIIGSTKVTTHNVLSKPVTFVNNSRFRYIGKDRWTKDYIYCTLGLDKYLYIKSANPQFRYLEKVTISSVFEDPLKVYEYNYSQGFCNCDSQPCDPLDIEVPVQEDLIPQIIELCVRDLGRMIYNPEDKVNNSTDDQSDIQMRVAKMNSDA